MIPPPQLTQEEEAAFIAAMSDPSERRAIRRAVNRIASMFLFAQGPRDPSDMSRASGDCVCPLCVEPYWRHAVDPYDTFLHVLCNGERVKL